MIDVVLETLRAEFSDAVDAAKITRIAVRLLLAAALGGALGYERERSGQAAGTRTHMLVAMGAALFVSYAYFYEAGGWNQNSRFALIRAILERHTLQIDAYQLHTGDRALWRDQDRKSTRLNSSHSGESRMPSSA